MGEPYEAFNEDYKVMFDEKNGEGYLVIGPGLINMAKCKNVHYADKICRALNFVRMMKNINRD